ncbi:response regulator [Clostridium beijerinckii]|uniref:response regulator n=1 Tax=Clostridium beijerinckii TaxID=1520 RepID=UPI00080A15A7|nr:response regulator [Clostridium beijerinckii]OCA97194.1 histidine kinase [Clostridium beijerinckii]
MKKVLIVDDAVYMRLSLREILERNGFEVIGDAENGIEAIDKYKMLSPDIVTMAMDITMPEMDGIQALEEIKKIDSNAKVVMISAMGQEYIVRESIMNGAKGFIVKPFKEENVIKSLSKI